MHVVTFYSYKGGVGRTLALVNVAFELIKRNKRVLLVDFDLEAPGLPSYKPFKVTQGCLGIVDYVTEYLNKNESPDVSKYIVKVEDNLLVMPAGKMDGGYSTRLASIDWQKLYADHNGYLMFEDMRAQWKEMLNPDYVLIDSRTGHNDVGGFCTRQFPDVVVGMFFPNMQNIDGMAVVSKSIIDEEQSGRRNIDLIIVPSRVPDLDDDQDILAEHLRISEGRIGYSDPPVIIHQYDSMLLVDDAIFSKDRPKTRLAKEYASLASEIIRTNSYDEIGASSFLVSLYQKLQVRNAPLLKDKDRQRIDDISVIHSENGKILEEVADVRFMMLEYESAFQILTSAINRGNQSSSVYRKRAIALQALGRQEESISDLQKVLSLPNPMVMDVIAAVRILANNAPKALPDDLGEVVQNFTLDEQVLIAQPLMGDYSTLYMAEMILKGVTDKIENSGKQLPDKKFAIHNAIQSAKDDLILTLIGEGKFDAAIEALEEFSESQRGLAWYFNVAMAKWGRSGCPEVDDFIKVIKNDQIQFMSGANYNLCMAISFYIVGDNAEASKRADTAERFVSINPTPTFSPWRYINVSPSEFRRDIASVKNYFSRMGKNDGPMFISQKKTE